LLSVVSVNVVPVEGFERVTTTPGMTAPVASVTTPTMDELSCAEAALKAIAKSKRGRIADTTRRIFIKKLLARYLGTML